MIDITDESYESDLSEEESNKLLIMCGHAVGPHLSPAAQAVLNAANGSCMYRTDPEDTRLAVAAALRAAADQVVPEDYDPPTKHDEFVRGMTAGKTLRNTDVRAALHQIAAELEGQ